MSQLLASHSLRISRTPCMRVQPQLPPTLPTTLSRTPKTSWRSVTPWGHCEGPDLLQPATAHGHGHGASSERLSTVNPQHQLPLGILSREAVFFQMMSQNAKGSWSGLLLGDHLCN
ncbi:hypothetical protein MC885_011748 [Smutsia gigantea]|nr:hypothetical protein MC885_011748 [Smutsia gigantea]